MTYTRLEKLKIGIYATGSAILTGTAWLGAATALGASTALTSTAVAIGAVGSLLHTANSTRKKIEEQQRQDARDEAQQNSQRQFKEQFEILKPKIEPLLEERKKRTDTHKRTRAIDLTAELMRQQKVQTKEEDQLLDELAAAFQKVMQKNKYPPKTPHKGKTSTKAWRIIQIGQGFVNGLKNGAAVAFGAIQTGATLAKTSIPLNSYEMIIPVAIVGALIAIANSIQSNKEYSEKLRKEEQYEDSQLLTLELQKDYRHLAELVQLIEMRALNVQRDSQSLSTIEEAVVRPAVPTPVSADIRSSEERGPTRPEVRRNLPPRSHNYMEELTINIPTDTPLTGDDEALMKSLSASRGTTARFFGPAPKVGLGLDTNEFKTTVAITA